MYKSDVWRSADGVKWELVTPGCKAPQHDLVARGNPQTGLYGTVDQMCETDADCYGAEACDTVWKTCVCQMWMGREQFGLAVYGSYMYLSGGYTSVLISDVSSCGDRPCGGTDASSYRRYLSDVWRSSDGLHWELLTTKAFNGVGRGGHQMLTIPDISNEIGYLWVLGGRGLNVSASDGSLQLFNDIYIAPINPLNGLVSNWTLLTNATAHAALPWSLSSVPWSPRVGLKAVIQTASPANYFTRMLYVIGGSTDTSSATSANGSATGSAEFLDDIWAWRLDQQGESWRLDTTSDELFATSTLRYTPGASTAVYITPHSSLSTLVKWWTPDRIHHSSSSPLIAQPYITRAHLQRASNTMICTLFSYLQQ